MPDDPRFAALMERCDFEQPAVPEARRAVVVVARHAHRPTRAGTACR